MKEFTTMAELASAKTREEIVTWAAEMQKCPYDYEGEAIAEDVCKEGEDSEQCNACWLAALKGVKCKGEEEKPKKTTRKSKQQKAEEKVDSEIMSHMSDSWTGTNSSKNLAAKNSNEGVKALKALCKTVTKEEFLQNIQNNKICPSMYGFPDTMNNCQNHAIGSQCNDCWETIINAVEFKMEVSHGNDNAQGKTNIIEEAPVVDTTALVAPVKNDLKVLAHMDKLVEEIKNFKAQQKQWDDLLKEKIAEATAKVEEEKAKLQRAIDYNMSQIVVEFPQVEAKETKTQKKVSLVSGDIILKKATEKIDYDKEKLLAYAKEKGMNDYIETKESFKWGEFKKTLAITNGSIVDADGVVLTIDGLSVVVEEEKLEVK